jgi:hypothetical protein
MYKYDNIRLQKILKIDDNDLLYKKLIIENYLSEYPNDYNIYPTYIDILITLGDFERAKVYLFKAKKSLLENKQNITSKDKLDYNNIRILFFTGHYQECLDKINNYNKSADLFIVKLYCEKMLGILNIKDLDNQVYIIRQIINYNLDDFFKHINKHINGDIFLNGAKSSVFSPDFPLIKVIIEIQKSIPNDMALYHFFYDSSYYYKYDNCGKSANGDTDYFKVVALNNTNNLITMYPVIEGSGLPCVDLNYLQEKNQKRFITIKR